MGLPFFRQFSPGLQFLIFLMLHYLGTGLAQLVAGLLGITIWKFNVFVHPEMLMDLSNPGMLSFHRMTLVFLGLFGFLLPALIFRRYMELPDQDYLFARKRMDWKWVGWIGVVLVLSFPVINLFSQLNMQIQLPGEFGQAVAQSDHESQLYSNWLMLDSGYSSLIINLMVIAFLPALGEELFFRIIVMRAFSKIFRGIHVAVWMSALFFSLMHLNFEGILPRFFMGVLLGYVFVITGNLWYSVLLHFLNNALIVFLYWLAARGYDTVWLDNFGRHNAGQIIAVLALVLLTVWLIWRWKKARHYQVESEIMYR